MEPLFESVLNKSEAIERLQSQFLQPWGDFLEKGKKAQIGEVHDWNGKKFRKTELGWVPVVQSRKNSSEESKDRAPKWNGELRGSEKYGHPEFEQDLDIDRTTETQYKKDGKWTEDRIKKVHEPIVSSYVQKGYQNPDGQKTVTLMMGAPASGKGHLRKNLVDQEVIPSNLVAVDPDDIKTQGLAPDYDRYSELSARKAAGFVHEEGSDIAKKVFEAMEERGYDYLQDKVFADYGKLVKEISRLNRIGYKVKIVMASCPVDVAYKRMLARGKATGRYVPAKYFYKAHSDIEATWSKLMQNMPEGVISAQKYNTATQSNQPELVDNFEVQKQNQ